MNAAAKMIHQSNIFSGQVADIRLSKPFCLQVVLLLSVLFSALAVIYSTNVYREAFVQLQQTKDSSHELKLHWGQLLLEQASLETPARVQRLAEEKLNMVLPKGKKVYLLPLK